MQPAWLMGLDLVVSIASTVCMGVILVRDWRTRRYRLRLQPGGTVLFLAAILLLFAGGLVVRDLPQTALAEFLRRLGTGPALGALTMTTVLVAAWLHRYGRFVRIEPRDDTPA